MHAPGHASIGEDCLLSGDVMQARASLLLRLMLLNHRRSCLTQSSLYPYCTLESVFLLLVASTIPRNLSKKPSGSRQPSRASSGNEVQL